jgi:hypothetical protein
MLNILIILACLVGGYWLVSSIMSPGIDTTRRRKPEEGNGGGPGLRAHDHDWHLILDVPANASRRDIEAAYRRRLAKAESTGDSFETIRIQRAYEAALRNVKV